MSVNEYVKKKLLWGQMTSEMLLKSTNHPKKCEKKKKKNVKKSLKYHFVQFRIPLKSVVNSVLILCYFYALRNSKPCLFLD